MKTSDSTDSKAINMLSEADLKAYREQGFVVVHDLLTPDQIERFLNLSHSEELDREGTLKRHYVSDVYRELALEPRVVDKVEQILEGDAEVVQSMYLCKNPGGTGIPLHQDEHYIRNEPSSLMACWIALTDTGAKNGGFCVVPGSHKTGLLSTHQHAADADADEYEEELTLRDREGKQWKERMYRFEIDDLAPESIQTLEIPPGAGVLFDGKLIHGSFGNRSTDQPRLAFAIHYVRAGTWVFRTDVQPTMPVRLAE